MAKFSMCVLSETNCNVFIKVEIALLQNGEIIIQFQFTTMGIESDKEAKNDDMKHNFPMLLAHCYVGT